MQNKAMHKNEEGLLVPSICTLGFGVLSFAVNPLIGITTGIAGLGGLVLGSGICKKSNSSKDATKTVSLIEKIFFETGLRKIELGKDKKPVCIIPQVLDIRDEDGKRIVDLKVPMGFSMRELNQRCYFALKDYFNCVDIQFNSKGNCLYEMVLIYEQVKAKELSVWDNFWLSVGVYNGEKPNIELPKLLGVEDIKAGKKFVFLLPLGKSSHHLDKIDTTIKEFMGARSITIKYVKGTAKGVIVDINAIMEDIPTRVSFSLDGINDKEGFKILLGESVFGKLYANLKELPHLLLAGTTNSGKSVCLRSILMYLFCKYTPKELEVYLSDLKVSELTIFEKIKHVKRCVTTPEETHILLQDILAECNRRFNLFRECGNKANFDEYNASVSAKERLPYMFVVIEEYVIYTTGGGREASERQAILDKLISICRAAGIYVCLTVQRPTAKTLSDILKANLNNKIGFKTADEENSKVICGNNKLLYNLKGKGHGYLCIGGDRTEFQSMYIDATLINKLIKEYNLV